MTLPKRPSTALRQPEWAKYVNQLEARCAALEYSGDRLSGEQYNSMTADEKMRYHFGQLCQRLLDIDPECGHPKGCPAHFAAWPMIQAWKQRQGDLPADVTESLRRMVSADGQGRTCEFGEIRHAASNFVRAHIGSSSDPSENTPHGQL